MASQPPRRERASSDRAQPGLVPKRPGLQNRTISAPSGGLYKLDSSRTVMEGSSSSVGRTVIEEDESPTQGHGNGILSPRIGNEVRILPAVVELLEVSGSFIVPRPLLERVSRM